MTAQFTIVSVDETENGMSTITLSMTGSGSFAQAGTTPSGSITLVVPTSLVVAFVPNFVSTVTFG